MEVNNPNKQCGGFGRGSVLTARNVYAGVIFIIAGILWLLYNVDVLSRDAFKFIFSWQILLVVIGGFLMSQRNWVGGIVTMSIGVVFALSDFLNAAFVAKVAVPVMFIVLGANIIFRNVKKR